MADVVLKIDADTARYIAKLSAASEKTKDLAAGTKSIGDQWARVNTNMATSLLRGAALFEVVKKVGEAMNAFAKTTEGLSRQAGASALSRSKAISNAGLSDISGLDPAIRNMTGAASDQERTQGLDALGDFQKENNWKPSRRVVMQYIRLVSSGLYKAEDLLKLLKQGLALPTDEEMAAKLASLSPEAREELRFKEKEYQDEIDAQDIGNGPGKKNREFAAKRALQKLEHPVAGFISDTVNGVTGGLPEAIDRDINTVGGGRTPVQGAAAALGAAAPGAGILAYLLGRNRLDLTGHEPDRR